MDTQASWPLSGGGYAATTASSPYITLALHAGGQLLALAAALLLWLCWSVLESFSEPLLWAYLCSLSLRDVKRWLVRSAAAPEHTSVPRARRSARMLAGTWRPRPSGLLPQRSLQHAGSCKPTHCPSVQPSCCFCLQSSYGSCCRSCGRSWKRSIMSSRQRGRRVIACATLVFSCHCVNAWGRGA